MATYDFIIDLRQDFTPNIDVERQATATGEYEAYTPLTGVTMHLHTTRGSATALDATLSKSATERTSTPGRLYATFDVADLRTHLAASVSQRVWLMLYKDGELFYEPFSCLVRQDRLG